MAARGGRRVKWLLAILGSALLVAVVILGVTTWQIRRSTAVTRLGALAITYYLPPDGLTALGPVQPDFGVAGSGDIFLQTGKGLVDVAPDGAMSLVRAPGRPAITSLAIGADDAMLTIAGDYLGNLNAQGVPVLGAPLPYPGARVAASARPGMVYLFCRVPWGWRAYRFFESGTFQKLYQFDVPVVSIADTKDALYIASARLVVKVSKSGGEMVFRLPDDQPKTAITSIAAGADGLLFVATAASIYAVAGHGALTIVNDSGGEIRWRNGALYVHDPQRRLLYAVKPATAAMFDRKTA